MSPTSPDGEFLVLLGPLLGTPTLNLLHPAHLSCLPATPCPGSLPWPPSVVLGPFCGHRAPQASLEGGPGPLH